MTTFPSPTPYGQRRYAPRPAGRRQGIALCLSGGGFRNALFHLGAVRRLNELGILQQVTTVSAVSGGTTLAALLAQTVQLWHGGIVAAGTWECDIAAPFRRFTSANAMARAVLTGWLPWRWWSNRAVTMLADGFRARRLGAEKLRHLPDTPEFLFCATDLISGDQWVFDKKSGEDCTVATAVAVSSWLAPPFTGMRLRRLSLVDGAVSDFLGVEPVWRTHDTLLVSDGGGSFQPEWRTSLPWSLGRLAGTVTRHARDMQKRWLVGSFISGQLSGGYWSLLSSTRRYERRPGEYPGYSPALARDVIGGMRIDYDVCSDAEAAVLENHGYLMADAAIRAHLDHLCTAQAPLRVPHPAWMSEAKVRDAFRRSSRKVFLGQGRLRALLGATGPSLEPACRPTAASAVVATESTPPGQAVDSTREDVMSS